MHHDNYVLRFQEGTRSRHPTPEAVVVTPPSGMLSDVGEQLVILVDLTPPLPHRSREIRAIIFNTYWASSGSVVARLRRALAEANRHMVHTNVAAEPGAKCSGSVTAAVFLDKELFLGQIGPAYALVQSPDGRMQAFPQRDRLLMPLGGALPPVINVAYTQMEPGSTVMLATTAVAESQAREGWQKLLAGGATDEVVQQIVDTLTQTGASGSLALTRVSSDVRVPSLSMQRKRQKKGWGLFGRRPAPDHAIPQAESFESDDTSPPGVAVSGTDYSPDMAEPVSTSLTGHRMPVAAPDPSAPLPDFLRRRQDMADAGLADAGEGEPEPSSGWRFSAIRDWFKHFSLHRRERYQERRTTAERARLRQALRVLLPGKIESAGREKVRPVPHERGSVIGGVSLGVVALVFIITISIYLQFGGSARATELLARANDVLGEAYASQDVQDWENLRAICTQIKTIDPQNEEAKKLQTIADQAIDALESAAVLDARVLLDLGVAPTPRRLLVAKQWVYVLNTVTDEVIGLELAPDGITPVNGMAKTILKHGQTFYGESVSHLVDLAWIAPGGNYPDGAVFVYSDGGTIYIYEPALGVESITRQRIQGNLEPGMVTLMSALGDEFFLVQRQENQILTYASVNGIYDLPRDYFAPETAPHLQEVLDMGMDGRVYLLMGNSKDSTVRTYFDGAEDRSFKINNLPDPDLTPIVIAVDSDPDNGMVYLGDVQRGRIVMFDKRGNFLHQFRLPGEELSQLEAITVGESPNILYMITANRVYAAKLPPYLSQ
ncbi:MAG: hypothetical protein JXA21_18880 [Anaerolineae bacterium]|nr:hypothetical protein [Anaerolineae bacterium]